MEITTHYWSSGDGIYNWTYACGLKRDRKSSIYINPRDYRGNCNPKFKFNCKKCSESEILKQDLITLELVHDGFCTEAWIRYIKERVILDGKTF